MRFGIYLIYTLAALVLDATAFPHSGEVSTLCKRPVFIGTKLNEQNVTIGSFVD